MSRRGVSQHSLYPPDWKYIAWKVKDRAGWKCAACGVPNGPVPNVLTVHHIDFNPQNTSASNLIALCQRCHLKVQGMMTQPRTRLEVLQRLAARGHQLYFR